jgi:hypothetical protein
VAAVQNDLSTNRVNFNGYGELQSITNSKVRMEKLHKLPRIITLLQRRNFNLQSVNYSLTRTDHPISLKKY